MGEASSTESIGNGSDPGVGWMKSSLSMSNGHCVEIGRLADGRIGMRHSKIPDGPVLRFQPAEWAAFLKDLRDSGSWSPGN
jgi:hypothetical protein